MNIQKSFLDIQSKFIKDAPARRSAGVFFVLMMAVVLLIAPLANRSYAFADSKYAPNSVLASGKWIKIGVPESGVYMLTREQLSRWGFNDPTRVRVYGYGGARIEDLLSPSGYIDDLPMVPTFDGQNGTLYFYGVGPEAWSASLAGRYARTSNIYTTRGYYFITQVEANDTTATITEVPTSGQPSSSLPAKKFTARLQHEKDLTSPGQAGPQLVGEDFRYTPSREFKFDMPDRVEGSDVWFETSFVTKTYNQTSLLSFTANGKKVPETSTDRINATINDVHYHGTEGVTRHTVSDIEGNTLTLKLSLSSTTTIQGAWLNYIAVNYERHLQLDSNGQLLFWTNSTNLSLGNATETTRVFDVTNPGSITEINVSDVSDGRIQWASSYTGWRTYIAFNENAQVPVPEFIGNVSNQNLHALASQSVPDMVIVAPAAFMAQAQRIVKMHAEDPIDPLEVQVIDIEQVYNEFSSGMGDVSGIRKYFKMLWDKGAGDAPEGYSSKFRYAILLGRTSYDSRMLTDEVKSFTSVMIPTWMNATMRQSLNDTDGYGSDDFLAMLKDNSGSNKGIDDLSIAVGRIPLRTVNEVSNYIDKLEQYVNSNKKTGWKINTMFLADDGDTGRHLEQSESFIRNMSGIKDNPLFINKVYMDAFVREGSEYPMARNEMFRLLNEGVVWWSYIGHANDHSLSHNNQLNYNDLNGMYYKNVPVFYGATCDFLRWDQNSLSGGEIMFSERYGGAISIISATRPVYIYENGLLSNAFGRQLGARDSNGLLLTVGEIYRRAKNNILTDAGAHLSNTNRLKFVLMGDPAMRLATPSNLIEITEINGRSLDDYENNPVELNAMQTANIKGIVRDPAGNPKPDFNGIVNLTLYDAEYSTTTYGNPDAGTEGKVITFEQQGARLTTVSTSVTNGEFDVNISVPMDIQDNYRPAAITTYAYSTEGVEEASGHTNRLYVYGYDDNAQIDDNAPVIESMYLNHQTFANGDVTDSSPMLIAHISDDVGINLSTAGIGHSITVQLDGKQTFTDVANYYVPSTDGTTSGTINYPLSDLNKGDHTLTLRVWDTSANAATQTIDFKVAERVAPKIYDIYTDASPAHDKANFYITHDRPEQMATVTVEVFNMLGHKLWSNSTTGVSDLFTSTPVTWDLTDYAGRRVPRGIYLYRATISVDGETHDTGSRRLAVAAQ